MDAKVMLNQMLRMAPSMEYTYCPECKKHGLNTAMKYLKDMSFRHLALFECPRCGTTLDKPIHTAIPSALGIRPIPKVNYFRR